MEQRFGEGAAQWEYTFSIMDKVGIGMLLGFASVCLGVILHVVSVA